jgi:hypothetical protein
VDSEPSFGQAPRRGHGVAVAIAFIIVIAVLWGVEYVLGAVGTASSPGRQAAATPSARYLAVSCPGSAPGAPAMDCAKLARDVAGRTPLTAAQRAAGEQVATQIWAALATASLSSDPARCVPPTAVGRAPPPCRYVPAAPTDADVERARRALAGAGFTDAVVRLARADDPAPPGALLYAVSAGDACVLGYQQDGNGTGYGSHLVVGRLSTGECLVG